MLNVSIFSHSINLNTRIASSDSKNKEASISEAQKFVCDFIPVCSEFVYAFNSIRSKLHDLQHQETSQLEKREMVAKFDIEIAFRNVQLSRFITQWAVGYFKRRGKHNVSVTSRIMYSSTAPGNKEEPTNIALATASAGSGCENTEINTMDDTSLRGYSMYSKDKEIKPFMCNDLIEEALFGDFIHPNLASKESKSIELVREKYYRRSLFRKSARLKEIEDQWIACWSRKDLALRSLYTFPVTYANNALNETFEKLMFSEPPIINKSYVFGSLSFECPTKDAFDAVDASMGRIFADALLVGQAALMHYRHTSKLRKSFGDIDVELITSNEGDVPLLPKP